MCDGAYRKAIEWHSTHARHETIDLIGDLIRHGEERVNADLDPCRVVEQELGRPLEAVERATVVATILGPDPAAGRPPACHVQALQSLLTTYGEDFAPGPLFRLDLRPLALWHLAVGYGAGWHRVAVERHGDTWNGFWKRCYDPTPSEPVRHQSVLHGLVDGSVSQANRKTITARAIGGARLDEGARSALTRWISDRIAGSDCDCGFHDGRRWTCSRGEDGAGSKCRTQCCRHGLIAWERADPANGRVRNAALLPFGIFVARQVGTAG